MCKSPMGGVLALKGVIVVGSTFRTVYSAHLEKNAELVMMSRLEGRTFGRRESKLFPTSDEWEMSAGRTCLCIGWNCTSSPHMKPIKGNVIYQGGFARGFRIFAIVDETCMRERISLAESLARYVHVSIVLHQRWSPMTSCANHP